MQRLQRAPLWHNLYGSSWHHPQDRRRSQGLSIASNNQRWLGPLRPQHRPHAPRHGQAAGGAAIPWLNNHAPAARKVHPATQALQAVTRHTVAVDAGSAMCDQPLSRPCLRTAAAWRAWRPTTADLCTIAAPQQAVLAALNQVHMTATKQQVVGQRTTIQHKRTSTRFRSRGRLGLWSSVRRSASPLRLITARVSPQCAAYSWLPAEGAAHRALMTRRGCCRAAISHCTAGSCCRLLRPAWREPLQSCFWAG